MNNKCTFDEALYGSSVRRSSAGLNHHYSVPPHGPVPQATASLPPAAGVNRPDLGTARSRKGKNSHHPEHRTCYCAIQDC